MSRSDRVAAERHRAPQRLANLLQELGLPIDKIQINLIYQDTELGNYVLNYQLNEEVYPWLRSVASAKKRT